MYGNTTLIAQGLAHGQLNSFGAEHNARRRAAQLFWRLQVKASTQQLWRTLTGRCRPRQSLETAEASHTSHARRYLGLRTVPLHEIAGSEGRSRDFDAQFRPLRTHNKDRWAGIAAARFLGITLPPVELVQVGQRYYVRDGNHRISVALALGQAAIDAQVTLWQTA
jgi:hypothetical protein